MQNLTRIVSGLLLLSAALVSAAETTLGNGKGPQIAVDPHGNVFVVYGDTQNIHCRASLDGGKTFAEAVKVGALPSIPMMRRGPRIAADGNSVIITAISGAPKTGQDGNVTAFRSEDKGKTWTRIEKNLNTVDRSAREGFQALAAGPAGHFFCTWNDLRNNKMQVWGAASTNGGKTWSEDVLIYKPPEGGICPCCPTSVTCDAKGGIHVMFRNDIGGAKDMYSCSSTDGGKTFSAATKLGNGTWPLQVCPMDGGAIAATGTKVFTLWRRQKTIFAASPGEAERELGPGEQGWITVGTTGSYAVWITKRQGELMLLLPGGQPMKFATNASDPCIANALDGNGPVVLAWESGGKVLVSVIAERKK